MATKRFTVWVELTNDTRSMLVAGDDWTMIRFHHIPLLNIGERSSSEGDRCYFYWGAEEARALSDALVSEGGRACAGRLTVDLDFGSGIQGSGAESVKDGLTPEERTGDLIQFLREGSFKWTFVSRSCQNDEPNRS